MRFTEHQIEALVRACTFTMVGRGGDSDQGRAARVTWRRDPWLEIHRQYGPPGWIHAVTTDARLVRFVAAPRSEEASP